MEQLIILQGITLDQLLTRIEALVEKQINEKIQKPEPLKTSRHMSRNEVAEYLHISLPTLNEWTKLGWLRSYKMGNRVLYKSNEVDDSLRERKYGRS